ncbi:hypothetical protein BGZ49_000352 [Haplosporangium sp. Z 27]|nr:hypothetical protein BGZ49_000352 [Haplosporangium sp. Z 27]
MSFNSLDKDSITGSISTSSTYIPFEMDTPLLPFGEEYNCSNKTSNSRRHDDDIRLGSAHIVRSRSRSIPRLVIVHSHKQGEVNISQNDVVSGKDSPKHSIDSSNKVQHLAHFVEAPVKNGPLQLEQRNMTPSDSERFGDKSTEPSNKSDSESVLSLEESKENASTSKSGNPVRKIFESVKQTLKTVWTDDDDMSNLRWLYMPETITPADNPFFNVKQGVRFQDVVSKPPSMFPYPSQITYSSRYSSSVLASDPKVAGGQANLENEARLRERLTRRVLMKLKASGRYRRRPNITLPMTKGRINEPAEVARIRRVYSNPNIKPRGNTETRACDNEQDKLLEKMNRQARSDTIEWSVENSADTKLAGSAPIENFTITLPIQEYGLRSRKSLKGAISTRFPDQPQNKSLGHTPRLESTNTRQEHVCKKRQSSLDRYGRSGEDTALQDEQAIALDLSKGLRLLPEVVISTPELEYNTSPLSTGTSDLSLCPPQPLFHYQEGLKNPDNRSQYCIDCENEVDRLSVDDRMPPQGDCSNRSSIYSSRTASSLANSVYSTLSEDWNRPVYFAKSKSPRYPASLQSKIRVLPELVNLKVLIKSELVSTTETASQMESFVKKVKSRNLRHQDGSCIRVSQGDELSEVSYRISLKPIKNGNIDQREEENFASNFSGLCLSARPSRRDTLGFIEYDKEDNNEERSGDYDEGSDSTSDDGISVEGRRILDVNDTSEIEMLGINPSDPHPDPEAFYATHYEHFQLYGCFLETEIVHNNESKEGVESNDHKSVDIQKPTHKIASKSKKVLKRAFQSFRTILRGNITNSYTSLNKKSRDKGIEVISEPLPPCSVASGKRVDN